MNEANEKGAALERATKAIEEMVIRSHPGLAQAPLSIRPNAIIVRNGVRHEIDPLVRINEGSPYETLQIFECKNWQEPVDKNAVTIFADKVEALNAARGTLIGRSFTRDAKAQAQSKSKLELVTFDEDIWLPLSTMHLQGTGYHLTRFKAHVGRPVGTPDIPEPEWTSAACRYAGREPTFAQFS